MQDGEMEMAKGVAAWAVLYNVTEKGETNVNENGEDVEGGMWEEVKE